MDSRNSNSVSYKTQIPVGYVFKPSEDEIYSYFIPTRIRSRKPVLGVEEVDVYGDKSPDDLFGKRGLRNHIYLFTRLKKEKETHNRVKHSAGDGIWLCKKTTAVVREINGKEIRIGIMRQLKYKGGKQEWMMHEYCIEDEFLNYSYKINGCTYHPIPNPENLVFCHVYNKKAKRGNEITRINEEFNQQKKRKRNPNCENVNDGFNDNDHQSLLPEKPPQAYDRSNVDQAQPLVPQGEDDLFMMKNYGHGDQNLHIIHQQWSRPITNEGGDEWFSVEE